MDYTGPGTIGRTMAGKRLDAYVAALRDRKLRRRVYRVCAQIDRDFMIAMRDPHGEWARGNLYRWWNSAEFQKRFPRKPQAELRELLEDYSDSLFQEDYRPETNTQLALLRAQQWRKEEEWRIDFTRAEGHVRYSLSGIAVTFLLWALTDSTFVRICLWALFAINIINATELDEVAKRRPTTLTLVDPTDPAQHTQPPAEYAKPQPSASSL